MKPILILIALVVLFSPSLLAQAIVPTDSTGTATTYWQKINLLNQVAGNHKRVIIYNDATVSAKLFFCTQVADTAASKTRYQVQIKAAKSVEFSTPGYQFIFVKSDSASCPYRVQAF